MWYYQQLLFSSLTSRTMQAVCVVVTAVATATFTWALLNNRWLTVTYDFDAIVNRVNGTDINWRLLRPFGAAPTAPPIGLLLFDRRDAGGDGHRCGVDIAHNASLVMNEYAGVFYLCRAVLGMRLSLTSRTHLQMRNSSRR